MFSLQELVLNNVNGIEHLSLKFNKRLNLICGPNGIGKTTILESIVQLFNTHSSMSVKKKAGNEKGEIIVTYLKQNVPFSSKYELNAFYPIEKDKQHGIYQEASNIILVESNRGITYRNLNTIKRDPEINIQSYYSRSSQGIISGEIKEWFINRFLFSGHTGSLSTVQLQNLELAKSCFSVFDQTVEFSRVDASSFDIYIKTPTGEIPFEYLSSGYKSSIVILLGIIKEIEYRSQTQMLAVDYDSILLIDEVDVHLHPEWQAKLICGVKDIFKKSQIIATTHSPHTLQACEPNEIIALGMEANGRVVQRELSSKEYGFQGWNVEEILTDVMGMTKVRSPLYLKTIHEFELALKDENEASVLLHGEILQGMLHPESELRKLIKLQMTPFISK